MGGGQQPQQGGYPPRNYPPNNNPGPYNPNMNKQQFPNNMPNQYNTGGGMGKNMGGGGMNNTGNYPPYNKNQPMNPKGMGGVNN
jgi:hypothetical protein